MFKPPAPVRNWHNLGKSSSNCCTMCVLCGCGCNLAWQLHFLEQWSPRSRRCSGMGHWVYETWNSGWRIWPRPNFNHRSSRVPRGSRKTLGSEFGCGQILFPMVIPGDMEIFPKTLDILQVVAFAKFSWDLAGWRNKILTFGAGNNFWEPIWFLKLSLEPSRDRVLSCHLRGSREKFGHGTVFHFFKGFKLDINGIEKSNLGDILQTVLNDIDYAVVKFGK